MNSKIAGLASAMLIAGMVVAGAWALARVPAGVAVPIHFGFNGEPNRWAPAQIAFFLLPAVSTVVWGLMVVLPRVTPRGANLARSPVAYGTIWLAITAMLTALQGRIIAAAFERQTDTASFVTVLIGGFFVVTGNVMGKLRWNYVVGIRTPWALADEWVWDKTHRFGGWAFVMGGLILLAAALVPQQAAVRAFLLVGVTAAIVVATAAKSYLLWRERR